MRVGASWVLERLDKLISRYEAEPATLDKFFAELKEQMASILSELRSRTERVEGIVANQEDDLDKLRELGINEMLALKFIESRGLIDDFGQFSATEIMHQVTTKQHFN